MYSGRHTETIQIPSSPEFSTILGSPEAFPGPSQGLPGTFPGPAGALPRARWGPSGGVPGVFLGLPGGLLGPSGGLLAPSRGLLGLPGAFPGRGLPGVGPSWPPRGLWSPSHGLPGAVPVPSRGLHKSMSSQSTAAGSIIQYFICCTRIIFIMYDRIYYILSAIHHIS